MKYHLVPVAGILLCVSGEAVAKTVPAHRSLSSDQRDAAQRGYRGVTRQFTHVRFQLRREEMRQMRDKSIAETMKSSDLCSAGSAQHFEARAKDLDPAAGSSCRCAISRTALA